MPVKVYTLPNCVQCETTKKYLAKYDVPFTEVNLAEDKKAYEHVRSLGYSQAPVVEAGDQHWSGFSYSRLENVRKHHHSEGKEPKA